MSNSITVFQKFGLENPNISFSEVSNSFITNGFTSAAGNTYYNSLRLAEGILIKEDLGQGYCYTFLNAINIYSITDKKLLASKNFHNVVYSKQRLKSEAKKLLINILQNSAVQEGFYFDTDKAEQITDDVLNCAFNEDPRILLSRLTQHQAH